MNKIISVLLLSISSAVAFPLDEPAITTIYTPDGYDVYYPAGKANEWSVSRTSYGNSGLELLDRVGQSSRNTTDALLNGGSVIDSAFSDR
jgi:hypothetical protein